MGMSSGGGAAGWQSRRSRRRAAPVMAEINVTPMVDVMLVLLIIFMVAAPLLATQAPPSFSRSNSNGAAEDNPVQLKEGPGGTIFFNNQPITYEGLDAVLTQASGGNKNKKISIDQLCNSERAGLFKIINALTDAGYYNVNPSNECN